MIISVQDLPELDGKEFVANAHPLRVSLPYKGDYSLCIDSRRHKETSRLKPARNIFEEGTQLELSLEQIVHRELAADNVEDYLLPDVPERFMRGQHAVNGRVRVSGVGHYEYAGELDLHLLQPVYCLVYQGALVLKTHVVAGLELVPLGQIASLP